MRIRHVPVWILLVGVLLLAGALLAGCAKPAEKTIKIGALLEVTGVSSSLGQPEKNTLEMVVEEINKKGGINGKQVELKLYDIKSNEAEAKVMFKKLVEEDKVSVIVGPATSGPSIALKVEANNAKVPLISHAASFKIVEPVAESQYIFKTAQSDKVVLERIIDYFKGKGYKKIAFLSQSDAFGDSGRAEFEKMAPAAGLEVVAWERFKREDTDMTPQLTNVKKANPDAVLVWAIPPSASVVTKNYRELKLEMPLFHSHGIGNRTFIDQAGEAANGVVFPIGRLLVADILPDSDPQKKVLQEYAAAYKAKYNAPPSTFGGHAWDGINLALEAIKAVGTDPVKIRDYLENNVKGFVGISGVFNMSPQDHNGLTKDSLVMVKIEGGQYKLAE